MESKGLKRSRDETGLSSLLRAAAFLFMFVLAMMVTQCSQQTEEDPEVGLQALWSEIQEYYYSRDPISYRSSLFILFQEIDTLSLEVISERTRSLLEYTEQNGLDGLEPLLLAFVDAIVLLGTDEQKAEAWEFLAPLANRQERFQEDVAINMVIPIGRLSSPFIIDVRADVVRALAESLLDVATGNNGETAMGLPSITELMSQENTQEHVCNLPTLDSSESSDSGSTVAAHEDARAENCSNTGAAGGNSAGSATGDALGSAIMGTCYNGTTAERQRMTQFYRDLSACLASPSDDVDPGPQPPAFAWVAVGAAVFVGAEIILISKALFADPYTQQYQREADLYQEAVQELDRAVEKLEGAAKDLEDAESKLDDAESDESDARRDLQDAQDSLREAQEEGASEEEIAEKRQEVEDKDKAAEEKRKYREDAEKKVADAKAAKEKAEAEAEEKLKKAGEARPTSPGPDDAPFDDPACERVFGVPELNQQEDIDALAQILVDIVTNPAPDSTNDNSTNPLATEFCGVDDNTIHNNAAECSFPVMCQEGYYPDENCQCNTERPNPNFLVTANVLACASVIQCPEDQTAQLAGMMCICGQLGAEETTAPLPPPPLIKNFFETNYRHQPIVFDTDSPLTDLQQPLTEGFIFGVVEPQP